MRGQDYKVNWTQDWPQEAHILIRNQGKNIALFPSVTRALIRISHMMPWNSPEDYLIQSWGYQSLLE